MQTTPNAQEQAAISRIPPVEACRLYKKLSEIMGYQQFRFYDILKHKELLDTERQHFWEQMQLLFQIERPENPIKPPSTQLTLF